MKLLLILSTAIISGCMPIVEYKMVKNKLNSVENERDAYKRELSGCREENIRLRENLKRPPIREKITKEELEEIKKKAFQETDENYKARMQKLSEE